MQERYPVFIGYLFVGTPVWFTLRIDPVLGILSPVGRDRRD